MTGYVMLFNKSGFPCDRERMTAMTKQLQFRGPDGSDIEIIGPIGLAAAHFQTDESAVITQPYSLDGHTWIVGDVRLDDRSTLVNRLQSAGCSVALADSDLKLLLNAYSIWNGNCIDHLLGDFSFAIWDQRQRLIFGARDHFGVHPLFYVDNDRIFAISNSLACLRQHPDVSGELDELNLADFLLFGRRVDPAGTAFGQIRRLPAAHVIKWSSCSSSQKRYWQLPAYTEPLRMDAAEYVERFKELLRVAVSDRMRSSSVAVALSGGIDSTCIAATASDLCRTGKSNADLHAWTLSSPRLLPLDEEARFADMAANALKISHRVFNIDDYPLFLTMSGELIEAGAEPQALGMLPSHLDYYGQIRQNSRVLLTGQGGDIVFRGSSLYFLRLLNEGKWRRAISEAATCFLAFHQMPPLGIRSRIKRSLGWSRRPPEFPNWIRRDLASRLQLEERWAQQHQFHDGSQDGIRPEALQVLRGSLDPILEPYDAAWTRTTVDVRHPFLDVRLVDYLMQLPPLPWFANKSLVRQSWPEDLPDEIRKRQKCPLRGDPYNGRMLNTGKLAGNGISLSILQDYVSLAHLPEFHDWSVQPSWQADLLVSLAMWLNHIKSEICK